MTDDRTHGDAPLDLSALAELDAGLPDPTESARLRAVAATDPRAAAVLDALAATRAELAGLATPEVPAAVVARWTDALAAEPPLAGGRGDIGHGDIEHGDIERVRNRGPLSGSRRRWRLLAAAALVAVVVGAGLGALVSAPAPSPPAVTPVELVALGRTAVGTMDVGALADPGRRAACLRAVAPAAAGEALLGGRRVVLDGRPGVLLVLATGTTGGLRIVTVDPGCGPQGGTLLAQLVAG
jgi:hypothetical protein